MLKEKVATLFRGNSRSGIVLFAQLLLFPFTSEGLNVDDDSFGGEFPLLPLERPEKFLFSSFSLFPFEFFQRYWFTAAGLGMSVVRWSSRTFFSVFFFPPFGSAILKPNLKYKDETVS